MKRNNPLMHQDLYQRRKQQRKQTHTPPTQMTMKIGQLLMIIFIISSSSIFSSSQASPPDHEPRDDINYWCSTTPHPELCKIYVGGHNSYVPKQRTDFRTMAVQVAMEKVLQLQIHVENFRHRCRSKHVMAAWMDCVKLFDDTVLQLNRTLQGLQTTDESCTNFDAQTWLSTALTNLETCLEGSLQMNATNFISQIVGNNVSELISNSLAINGYFVGQEESQKENSGFPSWVSKGERKLLQSSSLLASRANYVVAKDGSGKFRSIQAAINYAVSSRRGTGRIVIYVKRGVYTENIEISNRMNEITLVGDGLRYTIITGSRSSSQGFTTYSSATVGIDGVGFIARGITFRNTAGPNKGQAVAVRSASDLSVFYACGFEGYQDTLFVHAQRQFFKSCYIYGTIDIIFGNAAVVFQNCVIYVRKPLPGQANMITAQGRGDPFQNTGISIQNSRIMAAPDVGPAVKSFQTYLGRPWQEYSRTVILKSYIGGLVNPAGWSPWNDSPFGQDTAYYGEYMNFGPGSSTQRRVKWKGFHVISSSSIASRFTVSSLIAGRVWLPATGVPFISGL